jgi:hypothetical protein
MLITCATVTHESGKAKRLERRKFKDGKVMDAWGDPTTDREAAAVCAAMAVRG